MIRNPVFVRNSGKTSRKCIPSKRRGSQSIYKRVVLEATDAEQIKTASNALKQKGEEIDLVKIMGFLTEWDMIGPFDNLERQGFYQDYGPELGLQNQYMGKTER